ncbi:SCO2322 family protein [Kitasatospora sp. NPDC057940]|uniref:SCO2322 family protein n=1 Tax=Kitasatospora sp. NPDC057940 TaxID=3346285 RepID=UPI0036DAADE6
MTPRPARPGRRGLGSLFGALLGAVLLLVASAGAPAEATTGYRYWSFWRAGGDGWLYQQQGPAVAVPPDGAVDGWRFAVSPDGGQDAARPRTAGDFAAVCADTPAQAGHKRVAVVLDFGTAADTGSGSASGSGSGSASGSGSGSGSASGSGSGSGETPPEQRSACASVVSNATSAEVLAAVAPPLRYDANGLLCAIAGFPKAGCADQLGSAAKPAGPSGDGGGSDSGPDVGLIAGGALIAVLAGGAVWQARRRRTS